MDAITQDTLLNPPNYKDKYVVTNPPLLQEIKVLIKYCMINTI